MKQKLGLIIALSMLVSQAFFAEGDLDGMSVGINFYDRTMYYPGEPDSNPAFVRVSIKNVGDSTLRFKLADDRMFSMDFNARTAKGLALKQTESLSRKRSTNQTVYFREIAIEAGEEYSFTENLKDYLQVDEPSVYYIDIDFYPELYKSRSISARSNRLTFEVRPSPAAAAASLIPVKAGSAEILRPEEISPDKVVERTIVARQKSLWDQYFLYMDTEAMLERSPAAKRGYRSASAAERERMMETYKADLMQSRIDGDIVAVPDKFTIEKTVYSQTEGTVLVTEWFDNRTFHEKKSYTYKLRQREGIWQIYDYSVVNMGTE